MQTWLPVADYAESARCLDRLRLGRQHQECIWLYNSLMRNGGWINHPAAKMWVSYPKEFVRYWVAVTNECCRRGMQIKIFPPAANFMALKDVKPDWLGREDFHASHRSALLRKYPHWYGRFGWKEPDNLPYVWPV